jgi:hypothetical protein
MYCAILLCLALMWAPGVAATPTYITAEANGGSGEIPSGHADLVFAVTSGEWVSEIEFPKWPRHRDHLVIRNSSAFATTLQAMASNLNVERFQLGARQSIEFYYSSNKRIWELSGDVLRMWPSKTGPVIPDNHPRLSTYEMWNGDWTREVTLPAKGNDGDIISITSYATYTSRVSTSNVMFAYTMPITTRDQWAFVYSGAFGKWLLRTSPWASPGNALQLPVPNKARMMVNVVSRLAGNIKLPAKAGDRDRIIIRSRINQAFEIDRANAMDGAASRLLARQQYEYVYTRETGKWERVSEPRAPILQAYQFPSGQLPRLNAPTTVIRFSNGNWFRTLQLPRGYGAGTRLIVDTSATYNVTVRGDGVAETLRTGELVAFVVTPNGRWSRETRTIDMLLLYDGRVAAQLGESAARARLVQSLTVVNQAFEDSRTNFRFRMVGVRKFTQPGWMTDPLVSLRTDPTAQAWLNELKADGMHYLGSTGNQGAWINGGKFNHVSVSSLWFDTTGMRWAVAWSLGADGQKPYAHGYRELGTVLAGKKIPYYSNTRRLTPDHGIRMGVAGRIDNVRAMNEFSAQVAAYR